MNIRYTAGQIAEGRAWLVNCYTVDQTAEDVAAMTALTVVRAVQHHYDGGWSAFITDCAVNSDADTAPVTDATIEFLDVSNTVLTSSVMDGDRATVEGMLGMLWVLMPRVWAVRITTGGTEPTQTLLRRPMVVSASPRMLPRPRRTA